MANLIYGINAAGGFSDIIDKDRALKELGLDVKDLSRIGNISSVISKNEFHHLSSGSGSPAQSIPENLIRRIDKYSKVTSKIDSIFEEKAGVNRFSTTGLHTSSTRGNLIINGPVGAPAIRYFSTELLNADTGDFEPLDISTSRISSWSRTGSKLSFGGDLQISNISPARASNVIANDDSTFLADSGAGGTLPGDTPKLKIGKLIINGKKQTTEITTRRFRAEQATHKLKVNINGTDYYVYAMKNIPLVFNGQFAGIAPTQNENGTNSVMNITSNTAFSTDYRVLTPDTNPPGSFSYESGSALAFRTRGGRRRRIIEAYQKPSSITSIQAENLNISNFPAADYLNLQEVKFSGNILEKFPNFKSKAPNVFRIDLSNNLLGNSPLGSIQRLNRLTDLVLDRLPDNIRFLNLGNSFGTSSIPRGKAISADFKSKLPLLNELDLSHVDNITSLDSPILPEINPSVTTFKFRHAIKCKTMPGATQTQNISLSGSNASTAGIGTPQKKSLMRIRRALNKFRVEFDSPGSGYTASSTLTFDTRVLSKSGARSPQGIPFGDIVMKTDSDGKIKGAYFRPHTSEAEFVLQEITEVKRPDGTQKTRRPHAGNAGLSGYSPMGYYVDCGLFSSPCSNTMYDFQKHNSVVTSRLDGYMNPFANSNRVNSFGFGFSDENEDIPRGSTINGGSDSHHEVYGQAGKNINLFAAVGSTLPPPFFIDNTKIRTLNFTSTNLLNSGQLGEKINFVKNISKIQPGLNTPSNYNYQQLFTLYDSPQNSPNGKITLFGSDSENSPIPGKYGIYKFRNCSELQDLNCSSSVIGGTLPVFAGNTKLKLVNFKGTHFNRTQGTYTNGAHYPLDQWFSCKNTLEEYYQTKNENGFGNQQMSLAFGGKKRNSAEVNGFAKLPMTRVETADEAASFELEIGDFSTDVLGSSLTKFQLNTGRSGYKDPPTLFRMNGNIPTFKKAINLEILDLNYNGFSQHIDSPQHPKGHSRNSDGTLVVSQQTGHFSLGYHYRTLKEFRIQQNHAIKGNISFHKLANEDTTTSKGMEKLGFMQINYNNFRRISDFGYPGDAPWAELYKVHAFDAFDCPGYSQASRQGSLEPGKPTYQGKAGRWLLDRRKDGTASKYEFLIPPLKSSDSAGFPRLRNLLLSNWDQKSARGPFIGFTPDGSDNMFEGCRFYGSDMLIDVRGCGFTKDSIVRTLKSLDNHLTQLNKRFGTIRFGFQRGYDSPSGDDPLAGTGTPGFPGSGNTDFRIYPYGQNGRQSRDTWNPDSVYINPRPDRGPLQYNNVAVNDLCRRLKDVHRISLQGIDWSRIPDDISAPGEIILTLTGTGANQLHSSRQSGNQFNLYNWNPTQLLGTLQIGSNTNPIDTDSTIELRVYKVNYLGQETIIDAFTLDGSQETLPSVKVYNFTMNIDGVNGDINKNEPSAPYRLSDSVPQLEPGIDANDFTDRTQTFSIRVEVDSLRGVTVQTTQSYTFVNFVQSRTGATEDADHANGEWKLELIS